LVSTVAGEQLLCFTPSEPLDHRLLRDLAEVIDVSQDGEHVTVTGTGNVVQAVMVALDRARIVPERLQVGQQSLEDVFVALTGQPLDEPEAVEVGR
jgi:ABC-2 type transport system ATP-binding protein